MDKELKTGIKKLEAITYKAYENYVLELARGYAAEQDRGRHEYPFRPQILEIQLVGEYPDTYLRILRHERTQDIKGWTAHSLWNVHTFMTAQDPDLDYSGKPVQMVVDILTYARAGGTQPTAELSPEERGERITTLRDGFAAVSRRAFERHVLYLIQGFGPIQDARFREAHEESSAAIIFLRAELEGEHPGTRVKIYTLDRAQDVEMESRHPIWDPELAEGDAADVEHIPTPERIADEILIRARDPELGDLTAASASGTEWRERYAAVERRAFELHVLDLIQGHSSIEDGRFRDVVDNTLLFLRAELVGEFPKTYVRIYVYDQVRDLEIEGGYPIWKPAYAEGEAADVEHMRRPGWIANDIMMLARGGYSSPASRFR